jgi:hypothetical protein
MLEVSTRRTPFRAEAPGMKPPRIRYTVNGMMVAVALVAVFLGTLRMGYVAGVGILMLAVCLGCLIPDRH